MEIKSVNWANIEKLLKNNFRDRVRLSKMTEHRYVLSLDEEASAILYDMSDLTREIVGVSLRASILPNDAAGTVAVMALENIVLIDENFEFKDGERLTGNAALEYVFGQFFSRKLVDAAKILEKQTAGQLPN